MMALLSTSHKHHPLHHWLYYAREERTAQMPSVKRVNASVIEVQQSLNMHRFSFLTGAIESITKESLFALASE